MLTNSKKNDVATKIIGSDVSNFSSSSNLLSMSHCSNTDLTLTSSQHNLEQNDFFNQEYNPTEKVGFNNKSELDKALPQLWHHDYNTSNFNDALSYNTHHEHEIASNLHILELEMLANTTRGAPEVSCLGESQMSLFESDSCAFKGQSEPFMETNNYYQDPTELGNPSKFLTETPTGWGNSYEPQNQVYNTFRQDIQLNYNTDFFTNEQQPLYPNCAPQLENQAISSTLLNLYQDIKSSKNNIKEASANYSVNLQHNNNPLYSNIQEYQSRYPLSNSLKNPGQTIIPKKKKNISKGINSIQQQFLSKNVHHPYYQPIYFKEKTVVALKDLIRENDALKREVAEARKQREVEEMES
ncbi:hypothetical protein HDU92_000628, partial [Lobulomyces angularis]